MDCPFQVGDRIYDVIGLPTVEASLDGTVTIIERSDRTVLLTQKEDTPIATVIAVGIDHFSYRFDRPVSVGLHHWGLWINGGDCHSDRYHHWAKV